MNPIGQLSHDGTGYLVKYLDPRLRGGGGGGEGGGVKATLRYQYKIKQTLCFTLGVSLPRMKRR